MPDLLTAEEIAWAPAGLGPEVHRTPVVPMVDGGGLDGMGRLLLKLENLQVTGSYKARAASSVLKSLAQDQRGSGVVIASSGNFGRAFAYVGRKLGVPVVVVCARGTLEHKKRKIRELAGEVIEADSYAGRAEVVARVAAERGMIAIEHESDRRVACAHSTVGTELLDIPHLNSVLVPVGSGGLIAGMASAIKLARPGIRVIGVQPVGAAAMYESWRVGRPVAIAKNETIADALSATVVHPFLLAHVLARVDEIILVEEEEIMVAMRALAACKVMAEPAGAVAVAGFLSERITADEGVSVAVVTGGNQDLASWMELVDPARVRAR
jgi:threonine dehydratase